MNAVFIKCPVFISQDEVMMEADLVALGTLLVSLACGAFGGCSFDYMKVIDTS